MRKLEVIQGKVFDIIAVTDTAIAQMAQQYMPLKIDGLKDKEGYKKVHDARIVVKETRIKVEKKRKELKEGALRYGQAIDKEANRIKGLLEPIENHLETEEAAVDNEKARIKAEAEVKEAAQIQERRNRLAGLGIGFNGQIWTCDLERVGIKALPDVLVRTLTDAQFEEQVLAFNMLIAEEKRLVEAKEAKHKEETKRIAKIAAEQEAERQHLAEIARKQEEESNRLKAEQKAIENAKQKAIDDAKHVEELEATRKEAAERARTEAEERIKREAKQKAEEERQAKITAERKEARRPDKEKLLAFAEMEYDFPTMKTAEGKAIMKEFKTGIAIIIKQLKERAKTL